MKVLGENLFLSESDNGLKKVIKGTYSGFKVVAVLLILFIFWWLLPIIIAIVKDNLVLFFEWDIFFNKGLSFRVSILFDKIRLSFSFTVCLITLSVMFFRIRYIISEEKKEYFLNILICFVFSINILIYFPNMFMLLLGWDGLGITSYLLVIYYLSDRALSAGIITAITNRVGDGFLILSVA